MRRGEKSGWRLDKRNPRSLDGLSALICGRSASSLSPAPACRKNYRTASATGYWLPATGYRLPATGYRLLATGYCLPATGYRLPATGYWLLVLVGTSGPCLLSLPGLLFVLLLSPLQYAPALPRDPVKPGRKTNNSAEEEKPRPGFNEPIQQPARPQEQQEREKELQAGRRIAQHVSRRLGFVHLRQPSVAAADLPHLRHAGPGCG